MDSYREWLKFRKKFPKYPSSWYFNILDLLKLLQSNFSIWRIFPKNLILMAGKIQFGMELSILKCLFVIYYYHVLQLNRIQYNEQGTLYTNTKTVCFGLSPIFRDTIKYVRRSSQSSRSVTVRQGTQWSWKFILFISVHWYHCII